MFIFWVLYFDRFPSLQEVLSTVSMLPVSTATCERKPIKMDLLTILVIAGEGGVYFK